MQHPIAEEKFQNCLDKSKIGPYYISKTAEAQQHQQYVHFIPTKNLL